MTRDAFSASESIAKDRWPVTSRQKHGRFYRSIVGSTIAFDTTVNAWPVGQFNPVAAA
jgi:hypothetical protein